MERLTKRKALGDKEINIVDRDNCFDLWEDYFDLWGVPKEFAGPAIDRLAAYEDTGLEPEDILNLCEMDKRTKMAKMLRWEDAEKDGRLVVLAVRPGRIVTDANRIFRIDDGKVCTNFVERVTIYEDEYGKLRKLYETEDGGWFKLDSFDIYDSAFFTEAEARKALEREGGAK